MQCKTFLFTRAYLQPAQIFLPGSRSKTTAYPFIQKMLLMVKLTGLLVFLFCMQVAARGYSQDKISVSFNGAKLVKVFHYLERKSGYVFYYNNNEIENLPRIDLTLNNVTVPEILDSLSHSLALHYNILDNKLIVVRKGTLSVGATPVEGSVTDSSGNPLIGVTVQVKGTKVGTTTDAQGHFEIDAPDNATLVFSYVGYANKEVPVNGRGTINVTLSASATGLNEVVVVGYGTQKKVNLTGSVATVSSKQLENRPVTSTTNALEGTMPGVTVIHNNGQPGRDEGTIRIRGIGTLNNSNPMVVVDGVISSMNDVNPNDIASITVLKDAASAAIYGSRAANGVILITTKKGKEGSLQMHYDYYIGKQKAVALPDFLPSWQAATLYNEALENEGKTPRYTAGQIQKFKDGSDPYNYPNTDWLGLFYQGSGLQQNHYFSINGGSDKTQFMFSLGYFDQKGIVKGSHAKRYTTRLNLTSQVTSRVKVHANLSYTYAPMVEPVSSYPGVPQFSQLIRQINRISPVIPYKYKNGHYGYIADGSPMAWLNSGGQNKENAYNFFGTAGADWEIVNGLHFEPMIAYRLDMDRNERFVPDIQYYDSLGDPTMNQGPNNLTDHNDFTNVITLQALLHYSRTFGGAHHIKILAGYSQEYTRFSFLQGYRQNFLNNSLTQLNAGPTIGQTATGSADELALRSYFGRLNYDYKGKYLLEGNLRYDGSSRFAPGNQWGLYPSVSAGWNVSDESFFASLRNWFSHLKLRASWGQLGNQNLVINGNTLYYPAISTVSSGQNYSFGGTSPVIAPGIAPTAGANSNITWETTTETDGGLDAVFLNGRVTFTADYFVKKTSNILLNVPVAAPYGLSAPVQNAGAVQNKGWEFDVGYNDQAGDFKYGISGNISFIKNEITNLDNTGPIISGGTFRQVGYPIDAFYGYIAEGIFQTQKQVDDHAKQKLGGPTAPGDIIYKDLNGDSVVNGADRTYLGTYFPKITYGFTINLGWKGIDLTAFFQGAAGVKNYLQGEIFGQVSDGAGKPTAIMLDAWTPQNHSTKFPRLWYSYAQNDPLQTPSSFWVRSAAYLRLKNLQVGYTFPEKWIHHVGLTNARIYYSGQNILTFTQFYKWVDPESPTAERGYDYPQVKVNTIGVNLTF